MFDQALTASRGYRSGPGLNKWAFPSSSSVEWAVPCGHSCQARAKGLSLREISCAIRLLFAGSALVVPDLGPSKS